MKRSIRFCLTFAAVVAASGCLNNKPEAQLAKPPEVLVSVPVVRDVADYEVFTGRMEAVASVEVRARVTGYLDKSFFKEGMEVKQGQVLFKIDPRTYQAELERAEAAVKQAEAHLQRLDADYQRARVLFEKRAMGREDYDKAAGDRAEAEAGVRSAKASRDVAKLNLDFTDVTAPLDGRVSRRLIDPGNLVKADDTVLTSIVSLDPMYAYFDVDERTLLKFRRLLQKGKVVSARQTPLEVDVGLADEDNFPHHGTVDFIDNRVDAQTGTLRVRALLQNPKVDAVNNRMYTPGLFVRARIPVGPPRQTLLIVEQAIGTDQGRKFLYVVDKDSMVDYRQVTLGPLSDGMRAVEQGLKADERVVVSGLQRVKKGVTVDPKLVDMPTAGQNTVPVVMSGSSQTQKAAAKSSAAPQKQ